MFNKHHAASTDETAEHAALYCLGDFSAEDRSSYEDHLSSCAACRSEVEKYSAVIAELSLVEPGALAASARKDFLNLVHDEKTHSDQWAKIRSVLITADLPARPVRERNREQVPTALHRLATRLLGSEQELLDALVRAALELCDAGTAGFSMLYEDEQLFRWDAVAGALVEAKGGTTPRAWSPCGTTLDLGAPQLFSHPSRCFEYFDNSPQPIFEGLVIPVYVDEKPLGTLWVASHDDRKFDKEDLQALQSCADFCGPAIGIMRQRLAEQGAKAKSVYGN